MLIDYYLYYLAFPIVALPIFALYGLIDRKNAVILTLSFFVSAVFLLIFDSVAISACTLLLLPALLKYFDYLLSFFIRQTPVFALVVSKNNNCIILKRFDGTDDIRLNVLNPDVLKVGSILRLTEK